MEITFQVMAAIRTAILSLVSIKTVKANFQKSVEME